jgi:tetratricopeptide (TPR) repeat protein
MPLGPEATRELLGDLLGTDPSLAGLAERIHQRTGGNPFFIEEVVHSLVDSGQLEGPRGSYRLTTPVAQIRVPESVQSVLAARIDRLSEREKQLLQTASVIGKAFPESVLDRVSELPNQDLREALETLKGAEFIFEASLYPELEYEFRHPLTQEVAYGSQLTERRQRIHAAVARAFIELDPEDQGERAALLAHHWEAAGEDLEAARWHRRAAEWTGVGDIAEAQRHWQRVRELARGLSDVPGGAQLGVVACGWILNMGYRLGLPDDEEREVFADGKRWAEQTGGLEANAILELHYSGSRLQHGDLEGALTQAREAERLAEQTGELDANLLGSYSLAVTLELAGRLDEETIVLERAIEATRDRPDAGTDFSAMNLHIFARMERAVPEYITGDLEVARQMLDRSIEMARARGEPEVEGFALLHLGRLSQINGDIELGLARCRRGVEIAERFGSPYSVHSSRAALAGMLRLFGQGEEAVMLLEEALRFARERRTQLAWESLRLAELAEAHLASGNLDAARRVAEEGVAAGQRIGTKVYESRAHLALARALLNQEGLAGARAIREALDRAEALHMETGARNYQPFVHLARAELARLEGDPQTRKTELRSALELFQKMKAPIRVREVEQLLAGAE